MKRHYGVSAWAYGGLGLGLFLVGVYLAGVDVLATAYGLIGGLSAGSDQVVWNYWAPDVVSSGSSAFGRGAAIVVGILISLVQVLVWHGQIQMETASGGQKILVFVAFVFNFATTAWALSGGAFWGGADALASLLRLAMIFGVTVLVFAVGAERSIVWGAQLIATSWPGIVQSLQARRGKGKDFPWGRDGYQPPQDMRKEGKHGKPSGNQHRTPQERDLQRLAEAQKRKGGDL